MEFLAAFAIVALAAGGLAVGLLAGRAPRASCGGLACAGRCAGCPKRRGAEDGGTDA